VKVGDLADQMGIPVKDAMVLTGKSNQNTILSEEEVEKAVQEYQAQDTPAAKGEKVVLFWSEVMNHAIVGVDPKTGVQQIVRFENFRLPCKVGSFSYNTVMASKEQDIRIVVDKPFRDVGDAKAFRALLEDKIYTGPNREAGAVRGMGFLLALFKRSENDEVAKTLQQHGVAGVIELAVRLKHFETLDKEG